MRVLFWSELFWPYVGGIEVQGLPFLRGLMARGHRAAVVTSHGSLDLPDQETHGGIPIHRFRFLEAMAARRLEELGHARRRLRQVKEEFRADVTVLNFTDPSAMFHWTTEPEPTSRTIVSIRVALPEREHAGPDTLVGRTLMNASWVTAVSRVMLEDVVGMAPYIRGKASAIHDGLDLPELAPSPLPFEKPRIVCLGRVVRDKGFDVAVRAMPMLCARFPQIKLVIAGGGPELDSLKRQAEEEGVAGAVEFPGWIAPERVPELLNGSTVVWMPSRWREAFGLVALQGMQMGRPVVASDVGGLPEVVAHGETGQLVPKEDSHALAEATARLLDQPELAIRMGTAGRRRAEQLFHLNNNVREYEALFSRLTQGTA